MKNSSLVLALLTRTFRIRLQHLDEDVIASLPKATQVIVPENKSLLSTKIFVAIYYILLVLLTVSS